MNGEADMTLSVLTYVADTGAMEEIQQHSILPAGAQNERWSTAEVEVHPSGRFVYVSNRGHDSIAMFAIDRSSGRITATGHVPTGGKTPRNFAIDPTGTRLYAANQDSNTLVHFDPDPVTGQLRLNGDVTQVGAPVCVLFSS